jgi:non-ribosomal peptide synthetase component E (peptide arylation enzyme)
MPLTIVKSNSPAESRRQKRRFEHTLRSEKGVVSKIAIPDHTMIVDISPLTSVGLVDKKVPRDMHQREDWSPSLRAVGPRAI